MFHAGDSACSERIKFTKLKKQKKNTIKSTDISLTLSYIFYKN